MDTTRNAFFQDLGTSVRRCVTCHQASDAWTVTPSHIQARFAATRRMDPIFRPNDGSGCPTQNVLTVRARREAYSLLLPLGTVMCNATGKIVQVTDLGRATVTGKMRGYREVQRTDSTRPSGASAVLPQRVGGDIDGCAGLLRHAIQPESLAAGQKRSGGASKDALGVVDVEGQSVAGGGDSAAG